VDWLAERIEATGGEAIVVECGERWTTQSPAKAELRRPNIMGVWRSKSPDAPWYAIDAHVDTVMVVGMEPYEPFSGELTRDGKIHGRGSCDTKAAFACLLSLLNDLRTESATGELDLPVNLVVCGTAGEETGRLGAHVFRDWLKAEKICAKEMLVTEPSLCTPVYAHKGTVRLEFHINGVAAHSSKPHLGKNALVASAQLTQALWAEHQRLQSRGGPLGPPTLTPTIAAGGHGPNIVPQHVCSITISSTTPPRLSGSLCLPVSLSLCISESVPLCRQVLPATTALLPYQKTTPCLRIPMKSSRVSSLSLTPPLTITHTAKASKWCSLGVRQPILTRC
jgi:acetylornithine deacetylase/succinyl-diaminopimelate desuccinylase-like protein